MKYDVILADPPWHFNVWSEDTGSGRSASAHYQTMTIDDICSLPIRDISSDNCALFLWCVWPSINIYPWRVLDAWGFEYKTKAFTWVKSLKSGDKFHFGMGYYTRANDEPCLLAVRGKMPVVSRSVSTIIYSPVRKHSQKPDEQYEKIEQLYPNMRYLELFARERHAGWDAFGNEVEGSVSIG